jgi:hypothetical protein
MTYFRNLRYENITMRHSEVGCSPDDICHHVNTSCDAVRTKIRSFLNSREMNVTTFQKVIGANSKSHSSFMGQKGPYKGSNSNIYSNAFAFLKARELNGIKHLKKSQKRRLRKDLRCIRNYSRRRNRPIRPHLRNPKKKIRAFLALPSVTQAGFLREIAKTYGPEKEI